MSIDSLVNSSFPLLSLARCNPQVIGPDDSMVLARDLMERHGIRHLPVMDLDKVIGIISDRDVLRCPQVHAQGNAASEATDDEPGKVRHWMTTGVVFLTEHDDVRTAAEKLLDYEVSGMPIVSERGGLLAMLEEASLLRHFVRRREPGDEEGFSPVVEHMSRKLVTVAPTDEIHHAIMTFTDRPFRHLPVVEDGRPVGMLSDRDVFAFLAKARAEGISPFEAAHRPVSDAMTAPPTHVNHLFTVMQAASVMRQRDVTAVLVLRVRELIGIFTSTDVMKFVAGRM